MCQWNCLTAAKSLAIETEYNLKWETNIFEKNNILLKYGCGVEVRSLIVQGINALMIQFGSICRYMQYSADKVDNDQLPPL